MAKNSRHGLTASAFADLPTPMDGGTPCRAYLTGSDEQTKDGRMMWHVYWAHDGGRGGKEYVTKQPMIWRQASRLCEALNRRAGLLDQVAKSA